MRLTAERAMLGVILLIVTLLVAMVGKLFWSLLG